MAQWVKWFDRRSKECFCILGIYTPIEGFLEKISNFFVIASSTTGRGGAVADRLAQIVSTDMYVGTSSRHTY